MLVKDRLWQYNLDIDGAAVSTPAATVDTNSRRVMSLGIWSLRPIYIDDVVSASHQLTVRDNQESRSNVSTRTIHRNRKKFRSRGSGVAESKSRSNLNTASEVVWGKTELDGEAVSRSELQCILVRGDDLKSHEVFEFQTSLHCLIEIFGYWHVELVVVVHDLASAQREAFA
ncbi:MAG: hypothetical protein ACI92S_003346 [Planctomycetaceae bacterium]|jgi:hypothetical protein